MDEHTELPIAEGPETEPVAVVHVEACVAFVGDSESHDGVCLACGWLLEDHEDLFAFLTDTRATAAA